MINSNTIISVITLCVNYLIPSPHCTAEIITLKKENRKRGNSKIHYYTTSSQLTDSTSTHNKIIEDIKNLKNSNQLDQNGIYKKNSIQQEQNKYTFF